MNLSEYVFARLWALKAFLVSWRSSQTRSLSDSNKWSRIRLHACSVLHTYILGDSPISLLRCFSLCFPRVTLEVTRAKIFMNFWLYRIQVIVLGAVHEWAGFRRVGKQDAEETILTCLVAGKKITFGTQASGMPEMSTFRLHWIQNQWMSGQKSDPFENARGCTLRTLRYKEMYVAETYLDVQRTILGRGQRFFGHSFMINRFG